MATIENLNEVTTMSHFTVLVTKTQLKSVDEQLEPFYEQGDDGDYFMERQIEVEAGKYAEALRSIAAQKRDCHKRDLKAQKTAKAELEKGMGDRKQYEIERAQREAAYDGHHLKEAKELDALAETGGSEAQRDAIQDWYGGDWDGDGNLFHVYNPDAKWDWYSVGGRWTGYLKLKKGAHCELGESGVSQPRPKGRVADIAKVKDIDWDGMKAALRKSAEKRWADYQTALADGKEISPYFQFGVAKDESREHFIERQGTAATFAVLHDGEWHEQGEMGWWAIVTNEKEPDDWNAEFERIIASLDPDDELTVVDCHI
jgi:hypothetical protein